MDINVVVYQCLQAHFVNMIYAIQHSVLILHVKTMAHVFLFNHQLAFVYVNLVMLASFVRNEFHFVKIILVEIMVCFKKKRKEKERKEKMCKY